MPHRKAKKPRGSRGSKHDSCVQDFSDKSYHDLMVLLPKDNDKAARFLKFQQVVDRLEFLGYSSIALVHQVFGKPKDLNADKIFEPYEQILGGKKRKRPLQVYRRLHAVIENLSDIAFFTSNDQKLLVSYDLISLAPCNEAILQAVCSSALVNMITLDYSRGGLPFKVRSTYVQAAVDRNVAMEILYAPSIHHLPHRKGLIQTIRAVQSASTGKKLQLVVSSGGTDTNALRSPGDIANVLETLAGLDPVQARTAQSSAASWVLEEAQKGRRGDSSRIVTSVRFGSGKATEKDEQGGEPEKTVERKVPANDLVSDAEEEDEEANGDGFITL